LPQFGLGFEDKLAHLLAFGLLALLVERAIRLPSPLTEHAVAWSGCLSGVYALTDEWHQHAVPGRYFDLWDLAADLAGITLALCYLLLRRRRKRGWPPRRA
jgi:VanZ family protein